MSNAILTNVYNHYLTTYAPKSTSQYDTHKKSELRNIYNSIVKLNKESPWYLETTSPEAQQYAVNLKENARALHNSIASLNTAETGQALAKKTAYSSNPDVVSAEYVGEGSERSAPPLEIHVNSLATSQENMGTYLPAGRTDLPADAYSFDIAINDLNYEFQFNINENDTNRDVQERLSRLINNAGVGISATVDEVNGRTSLRLVSDTTGLQDGKDEIFRISDDHTSKRMGAVSYFGLNYVSREAANSSFLLNGEERSTSSNNFTISKMFEVKLKGVSEPDTTVSVGLKTDVESLADNVNTLVGSYNSFINSTSSYHETQSLSGRLVREMRGIASRYQESMSAMGITMQSNGILSVDDSRLKDAASSMDGSFSYDALRDFSNALMQKTTQVAINPMNYVDRTVVAYKNPGHNFASPYITSAYSGMMFNSYC